MATAIGQFKGGEDRGGCATAQTETEGMLESSDGDGGLGVRRREGGEAKERKKGNKILVSNSGGPMKLSSFHYFSS